MSYIIQRTDSGLPAYFSPKVARQYGAGGSGWTQERDHAISFTEERDAQEFIDTYLIHEGPFCVPVHHNRKGTA